MDNKRKRARHPVHQNGKKSPRDTTPIIINEQNVSREEIIEEYSPINMNANMNYNGNINTNMNINEEEYLQINNNQIIDEPDNGNDGNVDIQNTKSSDMIQNMKMVSPRDVVDENIKLESVSPREQPLILDVESPPKTPPKVSDIAIDGPKIEYRAISVKPKIPEDFEGAKSTPLKSISIKSSKKPSPINSPAIKLQSPAINSPAIKSPSIKSPSIKPESIRISSKKPSPAITPMKKESPIIPMKKESINSIKTPEHIFIKSSVDLSQRSQRSNRSGDRSMSARSRREIEELREQIRLIQEHQQSMSIPPIAPRTPDLINHTIYTGRRAESQKSNNPKSEQRNNPGSIVKTPRKSNTNPNSKTTGLEQEDKTIFDPTINRVPGTMQTDEIYAQYDKLSPYKQNDIRMKYKTRFDILRDANKNMTISPVDDIDPLSLVVKRYDSTVRYIMICGKANNYRIYLVMYWLGLEAICVNVLGLNAAGYTQFQYKTMVQYDQMMIELGEKYIDSQFNQWPIEVRIIVYGLFNLLLFIIAQTICSWISPSMIQPVLNMLQYYLTNSNMSTVNGDPVPTSGGGGFDVANILSTFGSMFVGGGGEGGFGLGNLVGNNAPAAEKPLGGPNDYRPRFES